MAPPIPTMAPKHSPPAMAMADLWESRLARNLRMLQRVKPSTDCDLDVKAYQNTIDEVQRGVTWGPKPVTMEMLRESVCLPRHGIYECHGEATELSVRVVDDGLVAESNLTYMRCNVESQAGGRGRDGGAVQDRDRRLPGGGDRRGNERLRKGVHTGPGVASTTSLAAVATVLAEEVRPGLVRGLVAALRRLGGPAAVLKVPRVGVLLLGGSVRRGKPALC